MSADLRAVTNSAGTRYKLGRRAPASTPRPRLALERYVPAALPTPPATGHYSRYAEHSLVDPYLNTGLGDCVIAAPLHAVDVFMGGAGATPPTFGTDQVTALYSAIGGYDPKQTAPDGSNPTDQGCDVQTMLRYWQDRGLCGHRIDGWLAIKPEQARVAMWLFENLIFGLALPDAWVTPMPDHNGYVWDVVGEPVPENGHCFVGVGWNMNGIIVDSWGLMGTVTYAAIEKYGTVAAGGEIYAALSQEAVAAAAGRAPNGFRLDELRSDLAALRRGAH